MRCLPETYICIESERERERERESEILCVDVWMNESSVGMNEVCVCVCNFCMLSLIIRSSCLDEMVIAEMVPLTVY